MSLKIIKAGMLDTVQGAGRTGYRHLGINPSGAMDTFSAELANALLGKIRGAPVIEMHFPASTFLFQKTTIACLTGADFSAKLNTNNLPLNQPFLVPANSLIHFDGLNSGARCYLSILHDLQVDEWLQSASTNLVAGAGGWKGRKLQKEDCLPFEENIDINAYLQKVLLTHLHWKVFPPPVQNFLDCIKGIEWDWLTEDGQQKFESSGFLISNLSDRMGYRLIGAELSAEIKSMVSSPVEFGNIQLMPNGQLIILMADHQTTGGYPRVAHVSSASLPSLAQLRPGSTIRFRLISLKEAEDNLIQQKKYLEQLQIACKLKMENILNAAL